MYLNVCVAFKKTKKQEAIRLLPARAAVYDTLCCPLEAPLLSRSM